MKTTNQLPNPAGDQVDRLLSGYYRSEMPAKWPAAPQPWAEITPSALPSRNQASRSRWALAASVAILVGGCWYLSGQITDGKARKDNDLTGGNASTEPVKKLAHPAPPTKTP